MMGRGEKVGKNNVLSHKQPRQLFILYTHAERHKYYACIIIIMPGRIL